MNDSFFGGGGIGNPGKGGVGAAAIDASSHEKRADRQGGMDLDELMDDNQTMENGLDGKRTLNASTANEFRAPKIPDRDRMISTAHDGGAGRGFRRRKVSTNFREMSASIDNGKQQQTGQRNDNPMLKSLESGVMNST